MRETAADTRDRLLAAASQLFAEHGFHGTKVRDISTRAGVNLASGHYHYGSKRDLYLAVLRTQFAEIRKMLVRRGAAPDERALAQLSRTQLEHRFEARIRVMLDMLIGPPPGLHGTLMQREMNDPSEALPVIVDEFILPMRQEMERIVGRLRPELSPDAVERCVMSVVGQCLFFRFCMPAILVMLDRSAYPRGFTRELAAHVAEFSLGGMERVALLQRKREKKSDRR